MATHWKSMACAFASGASTRPRARNFVAATTARLTAAAPRPRMISMLLSRNAPSCVRSFRRISTSVPWRCSVAGIDLGEWLVRNGLALDWPQYSKGRYAAAQREADQAGRGMWVGSYVEPWLYRACIRAMGTPAGCSDDANAHP